MKIGIVCPYSPFMPGGVQCHIEGQTKELRRRGHKVTLITPRPRGFSEEPPEGMVFVGQSTRINAPQHTSVDVSMSVDVDVIDKLLAEEQFDLLHVHEPLIPVLALQLLSRAKCQTVGTFHAALPDTLLAKLIAGSIGPYKRSVFKHLDVITAVSRAATSYIDGDVDLDKVHFIPNGIDTGAFEQAEQAKRDPDLVVYVGRLEKRKGVRYLLKAFSVLQQESSHMKLVIAGDGPERNMLEARARQLKLHNVEFAGFVSDEEKARLLGSCSVFTSPALYGESFGIVLLEAMAAGAVTVAGTNPGYEAVLHDTGRLSLVDPRREEEYARRLGLLATDKELREVWLKWAGEQLKQYSYRAIVDRYEVLYKQLVAAGR